MEKIFCHIFFCSQKFHKIVNYFIFEMLKKKIWASFKRIIELVPKNLSLSSQKYGFGIKKVPEPGSGSATLLKSNVADPVLFFFDPWIRIRDWVFRIPNPGSRIQ
jgi:hypothetical protein